MGKATSQRLTDKAVKGAEGPAKGQALIWDTDISGFALRVTSGGAKSFVLDYRADGRKRRITIGRYPAWSVAAAREEAKRLRREVDKGEDPMEDRHEDRRAPTVATLWDLYERDHLPNKRDARSDRQMWANDIKPVLGKVKVEDVTRADVRRLHRTISRRAPVRANRALAVVSKMFSLAVNDYEFRQDNPAKGIPKNSEDRRERYLSQAEIAAVSQALTDYPGGASAANAVRWLLLTGCRVGEALAMTWSQVDWQAGAWVKPSAHTKQKREHRVPLSAPAMQLLQSIADGQGNGETYVFPGRKPGEPIKQLNSVWKWVRERAGVQDVRLHDLRHTYASILVSKGLSLPMIGALLGHTQQATTQRYAHLYDDPLREATEAVGAVVTGASGGDGADVVPIKRGGGHG